MGCTRRGSDGLDHVFRIDVDALAAYEDAHPDWSIMDDIQQADKVRVTALNRLSTFLGYPYAEFVALGFTVQDLADIYVECMRSDLGFPTPEDSGQESPSA